MTEHHRPIIPRSMFAWLAVLVLAYWSAHVAHSELRAAVGRTRATVQAPFVVNGLQLRLDRFLTSTVVPDRPATRYLLILVSDSCRFSYDELPAWTRLINQVPFNRSTQIIIISVRGRTLANRLSETAAKRGLRYAMARVTDVLAFGVETGLSTTPTTAILDSELRVRLVTERISPTVADEIVRVFSM